MWCWKCNLQLIFSQSIKWQTTHWLWLFHSAISQVLPSPSSIIGCPLIPISNSEGQSRPHPQLTSAILQECKVWAWNPPLKKGFICGKDPLRKSSCPPYAALWNMSFSVWLNVVVKEQLCWFTVPSPSIPPLSPSMYIILIIFIAINSCFSLK